MDQHVAQKVRTLVDALVLASAAATASPAFPTGPDANGRVVFLGDFDGCRLAWIRWASTFSGFTAADLTIQHSHDGETWFTLKAFTQQTASPGSEVIYLLDSDPKPMRFIRALLDMTGTPGTSTHTVKVGYDQIGARGALAPPGWIEETT